MSSLLGTPLGDITLVGYILPEKKAPRAASGAVEDAEDSDADEEEVEEEPEFLDFTEMESVSAGGHAFRSSMPLRHEVEFQDIVSGKTCRVEGRLALRSPWWEVTCVVRRQRNKLVVSGYPSYKLCSGPDRSLVSLFLTACEVQPAELIKQFFDWLPEDRDISICNLMEALEDFEEGGNVGPAQCIRGCVSDSVAGKQAHAASLYPLVMEYLPRLLPGSFSGLLGMGKRRKRPAPATQTTQTTQTTQAAGEDDPGGKEDEVDLTLLAKLEEIIRTDVWKLGFNYVMYTELKVVRCEAQLRSFVECGLLDDVPPLQRNALWVYDQLKRSCCRSGSTYVAQRALCDALRCDPGTLDDEVWEAVRFLCILGVAVRHGQKVALRNLHRYETGIAECLRSLVEGEPWKIPVNVREVLRQAMEEKRREAKMRLAGTDADPESVPPRGAGSTLVKPEPDVDPDRIVSSPFSQREQSVSIKSEPGETGVNGIKAEPSAGDYEEPAAPVPPNSPCEADDLPPMELDPDQVRAAEMICSNPVTVISGKGGCGKTTVVSLLFRAAMERRSSDLEEVSNACADFENDSPRFLLSSPEGSEEGSGEEVVVERERALHGEKEEVVERERALHGEKEEVVERERALHGEKEEVVERERALHGEKEILLTAPTGRAVSLLTKKTGFTAYTLHQVLWNFMSNKKGEHGEPLDWKFKAVRVFVVDEGSLVCVQLLHTILTMLVKHAQLRKFVILGDVRQLPSIQPGNTLHDLFHSVNVAKWAIEMRTNHRAESELIVRNAGLIADMGLNHWYRPLYFDATVDLNRPGPPTMPSDDKRFILIRLPDRESDDDLQRTIKLLINTAPGLKDDCTSQFIAFRRLDVSLINELGCSIYNQHPTKDHKGRLAFQPGDKVCCTKNGYIGDEEEEGKEARRKREERERLVEADDGSGDGDEHERKKDKVRLCNGEIFFITEDRTTEEDSGSARRRRKRYLTLDDRNGRVVTVEFRELQRECRLQHAWARTIHTFQGSENETIVYVLGNPCAQTWKHVYTAVTRGQKRVYVIAKESGVEMAIRQRDKPRNTRLAGLVKEMLTGGPRDPLLSQPDGGGPPSQLGTPRSPVPGFGPTQSTPLSPRTPGRPRFAPKSLWKATPPVKEEEEAAAADSVSLGDDVAFSQAYSWSSMDSSSEGQAGRGEQRLGPCGQEPEAGASCTVDEGTPPQSRGSPGKRTLSPMPGTARKQLKMDDSPLGCSRLQQLTLRTPQGKWLYKDPPPE